MKKVLLTITTLSNSITHSNNYAIILKEQPGKRCLPIIIGKFEAQAIAIALENILSERPSTHDLFKNTLLVTGVELKEVIINNLDEGIFYAQLVCQQAETLHEIDARASDAIALALRFGCPIYTYEFVMDAAGVVLEEVDKEEETETNWKSEGMLSSYSENELNEMLEEMISKEEYEQAVHVRDELKKRKEQ